MRIAVTVDPEIPVPPATYGGIERVVEFLVQVLADRGHDVTLFANRESSVNANLVPFPGGDSRSRIDTFRNARCLASHHHHNSFDLVHSFSRLAYLLPIMLSQTPKIMSYQRYVTGKSIRLARFLGGDSMHFTAVSRRMTEPVANLADWNIIPNGVRKSLYEFSSDPGLDAPLVFLGRIEEIKGPHLAIEVARRTGKKLLIAGNIPGETKHQEYFKEKISPHLNSERIVYAGPVNDTAKNRILRRASALLMPVLWEEPFGIVMAEAMACGTPVLGLRKGAVPEVVVDGLTGYVCDSVDDMVEAVSRLPQLSREACRERMEHYYSDEAVVDRYEELYRRCLNSASTRSSGNRAT